MRLGLRLGFSGNYGASQAFLDQFGGASAAYSLRQLSSASTDVVRVRRFSDSTEQDFTAAEIDNNTMLNFVVPAAVQAKYNNAAYFGATDARVEIPISSTFFSGGNTISGTTIKPHANGNSRIFELDAATGQAFRLLITDIANGSATLTFRHRFSTSGDAVWVTDSANFPIGEAVDWSVTYDSSSTSNDPTITINGVTQSITETTAPVGSASAGVGDLVIGNTSQIFGTPFEGSTYDMAVGTSEYIGDGAANSNWLDQVNSNDGSVLGGAVAFTGQGFDGFVTTWYDQSGNGNDATQTTAANQPRIVTNGSVVTEGTKPAIDFDGANYFLKTATLIGSLSQNDLSVSSVMRRDVEADFYGVTEGETETPYTSQWFIPSNAAGTAWINATSIGTNASTAYVVLGFTSITQTNYTLPFTADVQAYLNGATDGAASTASIVNNEFWTQTAIGASANDGGQGFFDGRIQEIVAFKHTDVNMIELQQNQTNYYGL